MSSSSSSSSSNNNNTAICNANNLKELKYALGSLREKIVINYIITEDDFAKKIMDQKFKFGKNTPYYYRFQLWFKFNYFEYLEKLQEMIEYSKKECEVHSKKLAVLEENLNEALLQVNDFRIENVLDQMDSEKSNMKKCEANLKECEDLLAKHISLPDTEFEKFKNKIQQLIEDFIEKRKKKLVDACEKFIKNLQILIGRYKNDKYGDSKYLEKEFKNVNKFITCGGLDSALANTRYGNYFEVNFCLNDSKIPSSQLKLTDNSYSTYSKKLEKCRNTLEKCSPSDLNINNPSSDD